MTTKPTKAQTEAVRKELLNWVRVPADASWDMEYVARKVLDATEVRPPVGYSPSNTRVSNNTAAAEVGEKNPQVAEQYTSFGGCKIVTALTAAAEVGEHKCWTKEDAEIQRQLFREAEAATIEQCAQVAEQTQGVISDDYETKRQIAAAIRALKEKEKP